MDTKLIRGIGLILLVCACVKLIKSHIHINIACIMNLKCLNENILGIFSIHETTGHHKRNFKEYLQRMQEIRTSKMFLNYKLKNYKAKL